MKTIKDKKIDYPDIPETTEDYRKDAKVIYPTKKSHQDWLPEGMFRFMWAYRVGYFI